MHRLLEKLSPSAKRRVLEGLYGWIAEEAAAPPKADDRQMSIPGSFADMVAKS